MDRKFVTAAAAIGAVYTVFVLLAGVMAGKEAAGMAGAALTTLSVGLIGKFEGLRFTRPPSAAAAAIEIPVFQGWYFTLLVFAFLGIDFVVGMLLGSALVVLRIDPTGFLQSETIFEMFRQWQFLGVLLAVKCVGALFGGMCCGRTTGSLRSTYAALACLGSTFIGAVFPILAGILGGALSLASLFDQGIYIGAIFWLLYVAFAVLGVKLFAARAHGSALPLAASTLDLRPHVVQPTRSVTAPRTLVTPRRR